MSTLSPSYLPQVHAPIELVLSKLDDSEITYAISEINPKELKPSQLFTLSDDVSKVVLGKYPIWIDIDNNIIDGHHTWVKALLDNKLLKAVKLNMNFKDACRILNKIQDIYEYEQSRSLEEITTQADILNQENQTNSGVSDSEFLSSLEEDNKVIQTENPSKNQKTIIAFRKEPISENSVVGNFFTLNPIEGFNKYQIDFDNLLDTNELGLSYKKSQQPVDILAKIWFPNINFEKISSQNNISSNNLKAKAIAEKAIKLGFDGVKYGDSLIQGLK